MSRSSLSTTSTSSLDNMLSAPKPQRVPSPNLILDDPIVRAGITQQHLIHASIIPSSSQHQHHHHIHHHDVDNEYPLDEMDVTPPAFHTHISTTRDHSRTSSMASISSTTHYVISDELDEDYPSSSSISITSTSTSKRPSASINRSRPPSRSSWISVHLNTAMQTAVKRNSTRHETPPIPTHTKRSSIDASASAEIRSIIFARCDEDEEAAFAAASGMACSPPMRTHNPLIRDTLFSHSKPGLGFGATSIGSPSLTSIGSPVLQYSLAQALSKGNKGIMDSKQMDGNEQSQQPAPSPTNIGQGTGTGIGAGASTNGGRTIFQFSPPATPGIAAN